MQRIIDTHDGTDTIGERRFDRAPGGLECLRCRHVFETEDLARMQDIRGRAFIDCAWCDARNEVRAVPRSGLGIQPSAVVVRVMDERFG